MYQQGWERQYDRDRPLGPHAEAARQPGRQPQPPAQAFPPNRDESTLDRESRPKRQHAVKHQQPADAEKTWDQSENKRAPKRRTLADDAPAQEIAQQHAGL